MFDVYNNTRFLRMLAALLHYSHTQTVWFFVRISVLLYRIRYYQFGTHVDQRGYLIPSPDLLTSVYWWKPVIFDRKWKRFHRNFCFCGEILHTVRLHLSYLFDFSIKEGKKLSGQAITAAWAHNWRQKRYSVVQLRRCYPPKTEASMTKEEFKQCPTLCI